MVYKFVYSYDLKAHTHTMCELCYHPVQGFTVVPVQGIEKPWPTGATVYRALQRCELHKKAEKRMKAVSVYEVVSIYEIEAK